MHYMISYGVLAALFAIIIMWLDTKLLDNEKKKSTYWKVSLMVASVTALIIYIIGEDNLGHGVMTGGASSGMTYLADIKEEILTGPANF